MKCVFIIQGEGRGHSTQAIAMAEMLKSLGVEVCAAYIGKNHIGRNHDWVFKELNLEPKYFYSPNFVYKNNEVSLKRTAFKFIKNIGKIRKSIKYLKNELTQINPDFIINFYEPLAPFSKPDSKIPTITIGHQFLIDHPAYPKNLPLQRMLISLFNKLVAYKSDEVLALSFYPLFGQYKFRVAPPLLRKSILDAKAHKIYNKIACYVVNPEYAENISEQAYCYLKHNFVIYNEKYQNKGRNFQCKKISPDFVDDLLSAEYVVCSGGFETVAEANYHQKKILAVPVKNHAEQILNTIDASNRGIILTNNDYDLAELLQKDHKFNKYLFHREDYKDFYINFLNGFLKKLKKDLTLSEK